MVIGHQRPDGDAVGSMLGLSLSLRIRGKRADPVLAGGLPRRYRFLPGADSVLTSLPEGEPLVVSVDSADFKRLGFPDLPAVHLNIDHHQGNTRYADVDLVDSTAAATTAMLFRMAADLDLPIDPDIASNFLAGLITDTIGFRTDSVNADSLRVAAELVEAGAQISDLYRKALVQRSYNAVRYWGEGLTNLQRKDGVVWARLSLEDRRRAGYPGVDDADLIDVLTLIQEARVALVFVERADDEVKVSWRARPGVDVRKVAEQFGGGGHTLASGAVIEGSLDEVVQRVLAATEDAIPAA